MSILRQRVTAVWLALMMLTCLTTWGLSKDLLSPTAAVVGIFLVAAVKVRFVVLDFMELRSAPFVVRFVAEAWPVVVTVIILGFWFATAAIP